jgi:hypothetical protein
VVDGIKRVAIAGLCAMGLATAGAQMAFADVPASAPDTSISPDQATGPVIWNMNQETSALATSRTPDPEFAPKGIPLGDGGPWRLFPNLALNGSYDDNVFRIGKAAIVGPQDDFFLTASPTMVLDYQTSFLHADLYSDATFNEYSRLTTVDNTEYDFGLRGTYVISRAAQFSANVSYSQDMEALSSPDDVNAQVQPTQYNDFNASGQFKYQPNRLGFTVGGSVDIYNYLPALILGGAHADISDRNDDIYKGFAEGDYDFSPGYEAFVRAAYSSDQYDRYFDFTGIHRSSTGEAYDAGVKLLLSNLVQGEFYLGYLDDLYDHHQPQPLKDISGLDFGASLTWFPTELLTVHLGATRTIIDTTIVAAAGGDDSNVGLNADYEVTRTLHLTANADYDDTVYNVPALNQRLGTLTLGGGVKWFITHYVQATAAYAYSSRNSNVSGPGYTYRDNLATVGLNLQI